MQASSGMHACKVCEGVVFYKEEGYYYCDECHTRLGDVVEQVVCDSWAETPRHEIKTKIASKSSPVDKEYKWTTWEVYNCILHGMVNEVIELGASPNLKVIVLQLWVRYLQNLRVSFLSSGKKLPKLGLCYSERDAKIVYSMQRNKKEKEKKKKKKSIDINSLTENSLLLSARIRSKAKTALAKSTYEESISSRKSEVESSSHSSSSRRSSCMTKEGIQFESKKKKNESLNRRNLPTKNAYAVVYKVSKLKLLALLYIGLLLCEDDIQLSDLLRWIREGYLSYLNVFHLIPTDFVMKGKDIMQFSLPNILPSHKMVRSVAGALVKMLKIKCVPTPNLLKLIKRYVTELELPEEIATFTSALWLDYKPKMLSANKFPSSKSSKVSLSLPNYEGRAMALVLYSLKLLFGLDGITEQKLSKFASEANKILALGSGSLGLNNDETSYPASELFVWKKWVDYMQFRKAFLSRFSFPLPPTHDRKSMNIYRRKEDIVPVPPPSQSFFGHLEFLGKMEDKIRFENSTRKDSTWQKFMNEQLDNIINLMEIPQSYLPTFKPSLTPNYSNFHQLRDDNVLQDMWSLEVCEEPCSKLFKADFRNSSLDFLLNYERYVEALSREGVAVTVVHGTAYCENNKKHLKFVQPMILASEVSQTRGLIEVELTDDDGEDIRRISTRNLHSSIKSTGNAKRKRKIQSHKLKKNPQKSKKVRRTALELDICTDNKPSTPVSKKSKTKRLTMYLPFRKTWFIIAGKNYIHDHKFLELCQDMPNSFTWLLNLCSQVLEMSSHSLFDELNNVELVHMSGIKVTDRFFSRSITLAKAVW